MQDIDKEEVKRHKTHRLIQRLGFAFCAISFVLLFGYAVHVGVCEYDLYQLGTSAPCSSIDCVLERAESSNACRFLGPKSDLSSVQGKVDLGNNMNEWLNN